MKQVIPSLLTGLIGCHAIKLEVIVRRTLKGEIPVPLVIAYAEIAAALMWDDVIIVNNHMVISMWPVAVIERERREAVVLMSWDASTL
jgi:hypothetical protein